jgi:malto-oligosyltrehalose trehalohydrolase
MLTLVVLNLRGWRVHGNKRAELKTQATHLSASARAEQMPFGSVVLADGRVQFRLWAPSAQTVQLRLYDGSQQLTLPMISQGSGWYSLETDRAKAGTLYHYWIDEKTLVPDPASRYQPQDVHGPSMVLDRCDFKWSTHWSGRPWEETVLYELHVGTFTPEGTFAGVTGKLDYLRDLGVTAIELMPVADFPGRRGWGYDGVLLFAPESGYGTPDDLRTLIDTAHQKGMMVFLDVVYNHFGPEGNYLHVFAKQFFNDKHKTPWGAALNFDGPDSEVVRQFYVANILYWLEEFRFDGIRFDEVHAIRDDSNRHILEQIAQAVQAGPGRERQIHLVLENEDNIASLLERNGNKPKFFQAQWNDDIHHAMHVAGTKETTGYYADYAEGTSARSPVAHLARCLTEGFAYQAEPTSLRNGEVRGEVSCHLPPTAFVSFLQNHDQIGNRALGERIATLADVEANRALTAVFMLAPSIPMLYMGEEWGATTPFFYFCDLGDELAPLVTEGRRNEFAKFPEFQDPDKRSKIPDPVAPETFQRSKLDWQDLHETAHSETLKYHRHLLSLRQKHIVPLLKELTENDARVVEQHEGLIIARWNFADGVALYLVANLDDVKAHSSEIKQLSGANAVFESSEGIWARMSDG